MTRSRCSRGKSGGNRAAAALAVGQHLERSRARKWCDDLGALFIAPGELVRIDTRTGKYLERVRLEKKKDA